MNILELGKYAEQEHVGTTKHFIESGYTEWFIPVNKVEKPLGFPKIEIQGNKNQNSHANCRHQYKQCCKLPLQTDGSHGN